MKKHQFLYLALGLFLIAGCGDDDTENLRFPTSLNVFHGANGAPAVHVDYFLDDIALSSNPPLSFGGNLQLTLPSNEERGIDFISAQDTTEQLLRETVRFAEGEIHSLFLSGADGDLEPVIIQDFPLSFAMDSIMGVRFVNLSPDSGTVTVTREGETAAIGGGLDFGSASGFNELGADREAGIYTFEFRDDGGELLASTVFDPLPPPRFPNDRRQQFVFKNMTFVLIGMRDDGTGASTLSVRQVNNF